MMESAHVVKKEDIALLTTASDIDKGDEEMAESPNTESENGPHQKLEVPAKEKKTDEPAPVQYVQIPHPHDILSGRGNGANQHPGNIFFRC